MADNIRDLGQGAYLVNGMVILVQYDAVDTFSEGGRQFLIAQARRMSVSPVWRGKPVTGAAVLPKSHSHDGTTYPVCPIRFSMLPDGVREILREEFPDYADRI